MGLVIHSSGQASQVGGLSSGTTGVGMKIFGLSSTIVLKKVGAGFYFGLKGFVSTTLYVVGNIRRNHYTGESD